jgi:pantothenate kinase type III
VERIIAEVEAREGETLKVVVTGGAHEHVLPALRRADHVEPALTLKGLKLIYERSL